MLDDALKQVPVRELHNISATIGTLHANIASAVRMIVRNVRFEEPESVVEASSSQEEPSTVVKTVRQTAKGGI